MYTIQFYQDSREKYPAFEFFDNLEKTGRKKERDKIDTYIDMLEERGDVLLKNNTIAKYLEDDVYELKPGRYRVLYAKIDDKSYVILHVHIKKDKVEQNRQIKQAIRELKEFRKNNI